MKASKINRFKMGMAILTALAATLLAILIASAQGPTPSDDDVNQIAKKLYCPVCENTPLDVCPTEACRQWREQIRDMLSQGKTEAEIIDYFAATYGERAAGDPRDKIKAYLVPGIAILLGTIFLIAGLRMWKRPLAIAPGASEEEPQSAPQDEYIARLEAELKKRK